MNRENIIRMAQEAQMPFYWRTGEITYLDKLERFAALVASAERERIKQANAPEIERINAYIKEALAQPEQEPVAYVKTVIEALYENSDPVSVEAAELLERITTSPQRKPLTDKQILADETLRYYFGLNGGAGPVSKQGRRIVNAIEAAHGIKGEA